MKLNKKAFIAAAAAFLLTALPMSVYADSSVDDTNAAAKKFTEDGMFTYGFNEEGNVELYDFVNDHYPGEVVIPSEVEGKPVVYVGNACFAEATGITSVTIPASVAEMGDSVFFKCLSLEKFIVEEGNPYFSAGEDGVLMADDEQFLFCYPAGREGSEYTIPDTVDELAPSSFAYAKNLAVVSVPDSVCYIDGWAFAYSNLERITLPDSIVQLDDYAFAYCEKLSDVRLGNGIETIYNATFAFCPNLKEIEIPDSLLSVGQYAFAGTGLESVTLPASLEEISFCAFGYDENFNQINDFVIYGVPNSAAQLYCTASDGDNDYANDFAFISVEDPEASFVNEENSSADSAADSEGEQEETIEPTQAAAPQKQASPLTIVLIACGGVIVVLAAVLAVLLAKKPKKTEEQDEEA